VGSGGAGGPLPRGGAARTPDATSTTRRTLLELMAKMHFAEHTLFTLFRGLGAGKMGKIQKSINIVVHFLIDSRF